MDALTEKEGNFMNDLTHKERIVRALNHQEVDRIPLDYWGVDEITAKLMEHFHARDMIQLSRAMDLDKIILVSPSLKVDRCGMLDVPMKRIPLPNGAGYYEEPEYFPLGDCETIDDVDACYTFPSTDMFDYSVIPEQCRQAEGFALEGGYISLTYFYEMIRGTENMLMDFIANPELAEYILYRLQEFSYEHTKKILEAADGKIDVSQVTDDMGSQSGLLISPSMIDDFLGKYYDDNIKLVKSFGAKVFHHNDGAMTDALPWLAQKGIEVLNPLQWHLPGWNLKQIKKDYGEQICFHGGVDNQYVLPFGTVEEVRQEVRDCMDALFSDQTGYILAPCHNVQANTSIENVLAMYDTAREYSKTFY